MMLVMTALTTTTPFAFPATLPRVSHAAPIPQGSVADVRAELLAAAQEQRLQAKEFAQATSHTWSTVQYGGVQRFRRWLVRSGIADLNNGVPATLVAGICGAVVGVIVGETTGSPALGFSLIGGFTAIPAVLHVGARLVIEAAVRQETRARRAMVDEPAVAPIIERFRKAEGKAKCQIAVGIEKTRAQLDEQQVLSPEARAALRTVATEPQHGERGRRVHALASLLTEGVGPLDGVEKVSASLSQFPDAERRAVAEALRDLVFADRFRVAHMEYGTRNRLHDLLTREAGRSPDAPSAS